MDQSHPRNLKASAAGVQSKAEATTAVLARASPKGERKLLVIRHIFSSSFLFSRPRERVGELKHAFFCIPRQGAKGSLGSQRYSRRGRPFQAILVAK
jgi:hypothetical protein